MGKSLSKIVGEGTLWFSFNNIFIKLIGFISTLIVLRHFSIYEYGLVSLVLSIQAILGIFTMPGIDGVVVADMGIEKSKNNLSKSKNIFHSYMILLSLFSFLAWTILFFGATFVQQYYESPINLIKIMSFFFLIIPLRNAYTVLARFNLKFFQQSLLNLLEEFFKLLLLIVFIFYLQIGIDGILYAMLFAQVVAILTLSPVLWSLYSKILYSKNNEKLLLWRILVGHGKWSIFSTYIGDLNKSLRLWLIKVFLGTEVVGVYNLARGLYGHTASLIPFNKIISPIIPQFISDRDRFSQIVSKSIKYQLLGHLILGLFAFTVFPTVITYILPKYDSSIWMFQIMLIAFGPISIISVFNSTLFALKAQRNIFFSLIFRLMLTLILLPFLIKVFGVVGVPLEFVITSIIYTFERKYRVKKLVPTLKISLKHIFSIDTYDYLVLGKIKRTSLGVVSKFRLTR